MTDLKKWIEDVKKRLGEVRACKKRRLTPEEIRIRAELLRKDFPKALRMLEVAVKAIDTKFFTTALHWRTNNDALNKFDQIAKEK